MKDKFVITDANNGEIVLINLELVRERRINAADQTVTFVFSDDHAITSTETIDQLSQKAGW